ncbi:MAG: ATP synthase A1 subunit C [archaeon]|nr:ATP synthase A1 subunit C [archaeon]
MFGHKAKGNYAYAVARVKAKKAYLIGNDTYQKMLLMSLPEISRYISECGYMKEITELTSKFDGVDLIEHATYMNMARVLRSILNSTNGELHDTLAKYLEKWDIWNLKVILRGKSFGLDADGIREDLIPAGNLDSTFLNKLVSLETGEEVLDHCKNIGKVIPVEVIETYNKENNLAIIEDFLDKYRYEQLLSSINPLSKPTQLYQDFIRREIDITNIETILKLKMEGVYGNNIMKYIIPGGKDISKKLVVRLANAETLSATVDDLAQLSFYEDIKEALDTNTKSLKDVMIGMKKYKMKKTQSFSYLHPLSIIPIIDYMIRKENEVNNIRIIARGIESGLDKDIIGGLLVI